MKSIARLFLIVLALQGVAVSQQVACAGLHSRTAIDADSLLRAEKYKRIVPYGFVRTDLMFDSRRQMTLCGGEYSMIPYDEDWNMTPAQEALLAGLYDPADGFSMRYDRNADPHMRLLALATRLGININGPEWGNCKLTGKVETDFAGFGENNTVLRIRLAYMQFRWSGNVSHTLLAGQDYHPLSGNVMPDVLGFAAGAPFRPHSRTPQIRYTFQKQAFGLTAAALYQYQFTSPGPDGENAKYANQSLLPELFVGIHLGQPQREGYVQLGCDYTLLTIRDTLPAATLPSAYIRFTDRMSSFSPTLYAQYVGDNFSFKFRTLYAQNLGHLTMLSGYARVADPDNPSAYSYAPMRATVSYLNCSYGNRWRVNLFIGYQKNLGLGGGYSVLGSSMGADTYSRFFYMKKGIVNLNDIYRVAPSISFNANGLSLGLEYEMTACSYGDLQPNGRIADNSNLHRVVNHRVLTTVKYSF